MHRVPPWLHTLATLMVAIGTTMSAFWILSLNSWMQTPTGFEMREGVAHALDWWAIIFNPSFPYRLSHTLLASALTASFFVMGLSGYRMYRGDNKLAPKTAFKTAILAAAFFTPLQIFVGDLHGLNTLEHQPQKVAAMEGVWETEKGAPLLLFAIPDEASRSNQFEIGIPKLASVILTHDPDGEIKGLNDYVGNHPPVKPVFFGFRVMVGMGLLMLMVAAVGCFYLLKKREFPRKYLLLTIAMTFSGWVATLAGWYVTEIGRQPWLVSGVLTTADAATTIPAGNVALSLTLYAAVYIFLLVAYIKTLFLMARRSVEIEEILPEEMPKHKLHMANA
jgi:cytochrome d ubiquinol oxidase subunit I